MGAFHSSRKPSFDANGEVDFDHFQILRAIGKGAFGKVCIVQKKDTKAMYAMKYMNKYACIKKEAVKNVLRELEILKSLDHPFLVNLWFAFQDEEDMFMVVDLLLGGDVRYHLQQGIKFDEERVKLYLCELALALGYLRSKRIVHRDLKPDNMLLDEKGHVHLTDFNIATILEEGKLATSMSGTKPYMAPDIYFSMCDGNTGYSFGVDWWSLGICVYELLRAKRPYDIHSNTSLSDVKQIFSSESVTYPSSWSKDMVHLLQRVELTAVVSQLLQQNPEKRLDSIEALKQEKLLATMDWEAVELRKVQPKYIPPKDHLNCDPTYELEEMIIEAKPLHKKKKRLAKMSSKIDDGASLDPVQHSLQEIKTNFSVYDREKFLATKALSMTKPGLSTGESQANEDTSTSQPSKVEHDLSVKSI